MYGENVMNIFSKIYCRIYQGVFKIVLPMMPYREPDIIESVTGIKDILNEKNIKNVLIVTDKGIRDLKLTKTLEKDLKENKIKFFVYDETIPNPTINNIEDGYKMYLDNKCEAIIAFGGGSVMDCAKMIGARVANPEKSVSKMKGLLKVKNKLLNYVKKR